MSSMPLEPQAFAERVANLLRTMKPECEVCLSNPRELLVNGRRLDLDNLFRMVASEPDRGEEIVGHFLDQLLDGEALTAQELPIDFARSRIMPRIQPVSIFDHLSEELVAHVPFVNDTVVVFVIDLPHMTVSITTEQLMRWDLDTESVEAIARDNLSNYTADLEMQVIESREGGRAIIIGEQDGYDAARLLLGSLHTRLAPRLGGNFFVATPARDMFIAMSEGPGEFVDRLRGRVEQDYRRMPYPITKELFYVCRDGVAGTLGSLAA
ncbi:MAG: hypothetical protein CMJ31_06250 [Phycisphaerae bacterium]|nr:hypothetical protein [Phycisphaerae bacterium]